MGAIPTGSPYERSMTKEEMIELRKSIRLEIMQHCNDSNRHSFDMFKSLQLHMTERNKLNELDKDFTKERLMSLADTENRLIAELDRCKQYADRMEEILTECGRLRDGFQEQMKAMRIRIKDDLKDAIAATASKEIIEKVIERLGWHASLPA